MKTTMAQNLRGKLSAVRKDTHHLFKKPSSSLHMARAATVLKKALELTKLCGVDVCIIWYDREGNLVMTWPPEKKNDEEGNKVREMAERYSVLSEQERSKKSINLSGFLNKKMVHDKKESFKANGDSKFSQSLLGLEDSLQTRLKTLCLQRLHLDQQQPLLQDQRTESSFVDDVSTTSMNQPRSKFSVLLYNHENGAFTQLANSSALIPTFNKITWICCLGNKAATTWIFSCPPLFLRCKHRPQISSRHNRLLE